MVRASLKLALVIFDKRTGFPNGYEAIDARRAFG